MVILYSNYADRMADSVIREQTAQSDLALRSTGLSEYLGS